jgi:hypothetical protein
VTVVRLAVVSDEARPPAAPTAEQRMWAYYVTERAKGRTPSGAELDRIAGTNNYGRRVLRRWRQAPSARHGRPARSWGTTGAAGTGLRLVGGSCGVSAARACLVEHLLGKPECAGGVVPSG